MRARPVVLAAAARVCRSAIRGACDGSGWLGWVASPVFRDWFWVCAFAVWRWAMRARAAVRSVAARVSPCG